MNIHKLILPFLCVFPIFSELSALPPIAENGAALFTYVNDSLVEDENVLIQVVGVDPHTGFQCFISYDSAGNPSYVDIQSKIDSSLYGFPLTFFPKTSDGAGRVIYLPQLDGARVYTSIQQKIVFLVNQNEKGEWTISAPNPLNPDDPNRNTLWDKTEYAVNPSAIFINPTAVDDFSLPIYCEETGLDGTKQSGGITVSRTLVFNTINSTFQAGGTPWTSLVSTSPSLVYSPVYGSATGIFPQDLFVTSGWMEAFQTLFSTTPLQIDAEESLPVDKGGGIWRGTIDPVTNQITFVRVVDDTHPAVPSVTITLPTKTSELLAGSGPSWNIENNDPLKLVFARDISCMVDTNTTTTKEPLNQAYFRSQAMNFYKSNQAMPETLQFLDYYSQVLHSFGDHHIYTIPYDDELGQSGAASYTPANFAGGVIKLGPL